MCLVLKEQMVLSVDCSCVYAIQVFGGDKAKSRKTDNLKNEVAGLEAAVQAASQEYDRVKLRNTQVWLHTNTCTDVLVQNQQYHQICCLQFCSCTCFFAASKELLMHLRDVHNHHAFTRNFCYRKCHGGKSQGYKILMACWWAPTASCTSCHPFFACIACLSPCIRSFWTVI